VKLKAIDYRIGHTVKTLAEVELDYIVQVLKVCNGKRQKAARILGVSFNTMYRRCKELEAKGRIKRLPEAFYKRTPPKRYFGDE